MDLRAKAKEFPSVCKYNRLSYSHSYNKTGINQPSMREEHIGLKPIEISASRDLRQRAYRRGVQLRSDLRRLNTNQPNDAEQSGMQ